MQDRRRAKVLAVVALSIFVLVVGGVVVSKTHSNEQSSAQQYRDAVQQSGLAFESPVTDADIDKTADWTCADLRDYQTKNNKPDSGFGEALLILIEHGSEPIAIGIDPKYLVNFKQQAADNPKIYGELTLGEAKSIRSLRNIYCPDAPLADENATTSSTSEPLPPTSAVEQTAPPTSFRYTNKIEQILLGDPISPGDCVRSGICQLSSPSGNFYCTISATGAYCSAPVGEQLTAGVTDRLIKVDSQGNTGFLADSGGNSHLESRESMASSTFPYGNTLTAFNVTCGIDPDAGVACRENSSGHGFLVNRQQHTFF